jgi:hypothetical protein
MACNICGDINLLCNCQQSAQPFCDQCSEDNSCAETIDAACVIYHSDDSDPASKLSNTGLPNKTPIETVVEKLDEMLGGYQIPINATDTNTVDITANGLKNHNIKADVKVSATVGNTLAINSDGLYVPTPTPPLTIEQIILQLSTNPDFATLVCNLVKACYGDCPMIVDVT